MADSKDAALDLDSEDFTWPEHLVQKYPSLRRWNEGDHSEWKGGREQQLLEYIKGRPDFDQIQGKPDKVLAAIDDFATHEYFLINIGHDKGRRVAQLIAEQKPKIAVELGCYIGYSALLFADQMRKSCSDTETVQLRYWSLEFDVEIAAIAREIVSIAGMSDIVSVVDGAAADSLRALKSEGKLGSIDFFFLDHVEDLYVPDLKVAEQLGLLNAGALIVADNVLRPGAPDYRKYVRSHPGLETWAIPGLIVPADLQDEMDVSRVL